MAITIIVEDGTIVENANSYVSLEDLREYAGMNNYEISTDDETVKLAMLQACDFLNGLDYIGSPASAYAGMAFPRVIDGLEGVIPSQIVKAQCYLTCNALLGDIELFTTDVNTGNLGIASEKVSVLETSYFEGLHEDYLASTGNKKFPYIWSLLKPFFDNSKYTIGGVVSVQY